MQTLSRRACVYQESVTVPPPCWARFKGLKKLQTLAGKGLSGEQSLCYTWFCRAAQQYVPEAIYKLAQCKEDGWGCRVSMQEALAYYREAADGVCS